MHRRCALGFVIAWGWAVLGSPPRADAVLSTTNGGFDAQDGSVHLNSTLPPTGWFAGSLAANTQSDTLINAQNGAQGGWDANGHMFGQSAPFTNDGTSEQGYIYQRLGAYAGESSVSIRGYVYNRIVTPLVPPGNFEVGLYFSSPGLPVDHGLDIQFAGFVIGAPKVFSQGVDFMLDTSATPQRAAWTYTVTLAGSGVSPGDDVWLRIGDAGNPTSAAADAPVIDNVNVLPFDLGDVNGDDNVDIPNDFTPIRTNFRKLATSRAQGDLDGSGDVDLLDYLQWRREFLAGGGSPADIPALAGVPEPMTAALLAWGAAIGTAFVRRRRQRVGLRGPAPRAAAALVVGVLATVVLGGRAAAVDNPWVPATGAWNDVGNWGGGVVPNAAGDQVPVITNDGVATLTAPATSPVDGLILGQTAGTTGTLEIGAGGALSVINDTPAILNDGDGQVLVGQAGNGTLRMTGGTLAAVGVNSGNGAANLIELSGNAAATVSGSTSLGGTTRITGTTANVSTGFLTLRATSAFVAGITSATQFATVKAPGAATINGTLAVEFAGVTPAFGATWSLIESAAVVGNFTNAANVSVMGVAAPVLGETYRTHRVNGGAFGKKMELIHDRVLVLEVNRSNGSVSVRNPLGGPIQINGYSIASAAGSLKPGAGAWSSFADQGTTGWEEANPTATTLAELNPAAGGAFNFTSIASKPIGNAYDDGAAYFTRGVGAAGNDLVFDYTTTAGEVIRGQVSYVGVGKTNNLLVTINPSTGAATLKNDSPGAITIDAFSILSTGAALTPGTFAGLGSPLLTTVAPTTSALSQLAGNPMSPLAIAAGQSFNLGTVFNTAQPQTGITLEFTTGGQNIVYNGVVRFRTAAPGNYDGDSDVDGNDFLVWQRTLGATVTSGAGADGDGNGVIGAGDLVEWRVNYGQFPAATAAASAIPEPSGAALVGCLLGLAPVVRPRRLLRLSTTRHTSATPSQRENSMKTANAARSGRICAWGVLPIAMSAFAVFAPSSAHAIFGTFPSSGVYDEQLTNEGNNLMNAVDAEAAGNNVTLAQFKLDVETAFSANKGGVVGFDNETNPTEIVDTQFVALFGADLSFELLVSRQDGAFGLNNNANNDVISGHNYLGIQGSASPVNLGFSLPLETFAITALSRGGDRNPVLTIKYDNNTTQVFPTETVSAAVDDTVFIWKAPTGRTITGINFTIADGFVRFDDFAFVVANFQPGDVDGDLDVDAADYGLIKGNFGLSPATKAQGDLSGNGIVDLADFLQWKQFEAIAAHGAGAAVPEPCGVALATVALMSLYGCRRRGRPQGR
jgi:hypothetical protein